MKQPSLHSSVKESISQPFSYFLLCKCESENSLSAHFPGDVAKTSLFTHHVAVSFCSIMTDCEFVFTKLKYIKD